ncbi:hypothetical protein JCM10212_002429 [Sporobolomyces blumeae]
MMTDSTPQRRRSSVRRPSIAQDKLVPFSSAKPPAPGGEFRLVFIGAGQINFGGETGPWDHSFRLEHHLGTRLKVVALIDPSKATAEKVLERKRSSFVRSAYETTKICPSLEAFVDGMETDERPHAFIVGSPPAFRGSTKPGRDIELKILELFPQDTPAFFLEKPLSTDSPEEAQKVARSLADKNTIISVGYFLRYLRVVQKMRSIIEDNNLEVMATVGRYASTYSVSTKRDWWIKSRDQGPVVEQLTHFVDLSRYFGGDVDLSSVRAHALDWDEPAGTLTDMPIDESTISPDDRIPRVTSSTWKYKTGAVGTLTHMLVLQGYRYSCELEVYCDGYQLRLMDPYGHPELRVRSPESDEERIFTFERDDPYESELKVFIDAAEAHQSTDQAIAEDEDSQILSTYEDACKTYAFSWAIRHASELSQTKYRKNASGQ